MPQGDLQRYTIDPGYVILPERETQLVATVSSGVVVTIWDRRRKMGGMCHYVFPKRTGSRKSCSVFAVVAILALIRMFDQKGSNRQDLEAGLYGGSEKPLKVPLNLSDPAENIKVGMEILNRLKIKIANLDSGGSRLRRLAFDPATGDTLTAKTSRFELSDWHYQLAEMNG